MIKMKKSTQPRGKLSHEDLVQHCECAIHAAMDHFDIKEHEKDLNFYRGTHPLLLHQGKPLVHIHHPESIHHK